MVYLIRFMATPRREHPAGDRILGAYLDTGVGVPNLPEAVAAASFLLQLAGWIVNWPYEARAADGPDLDYPGGALNASAVAAFARAAGGGMGVVMTAWCN